MKSLRLALLFTIGLFLTSSTWPQKLCLGFLPENDLYISEEAGLLSKGGVTQADFNHVIDRIEAHYTPIIRRMGGALQVVRRWSDGTVNAYAERFGRTYQVTLMGGLARHPQMTTDGLMLVACHEMGHHLGGAPKLSSWFSTWANNEGQSDYFAGLRCLRAIWPNKETIDFVNNTPIDPVLISTCNRTWKSLSDRYLCMRIGMAGKAAALLFYENESESPKPNFATPDAHRVSRTDHTHPASQCRLDTYFQSGLCTRNNNEALSDSDVRKGTCTETAGYRVGIRPRCWYGERY